MNILILGANGFIGSHLSEAILAQTNWHVSAIDLANNHLRDCLSNPRFIFEQGDITKKPMWLQTQIQQCDVVLPLVAIATPALYVRDPLRVFELDFELNLAIVKQCVQYQKRIIFPSTSEVYGMCPDDAFDELNSCLVTGPIHKERWIYSTSKQLLDRVIYAYGKHRQLSYSLFRPFNWYGPRLDDIANPNSRVLTQFIGHVLRGEPIKLVNGGEQQRCFTYITDGIDAILKLIENKNNCANNKIFNVGNPNESISIRYVAEKLLTLVKSAYPDHAALTERVQLNLVDAKDYYGEGYQDVKLRVPAIHAARKELGWEPRIDFDTGLRKTLEYYFH